MSDHDYDSWKGLFPGTRGSTFPRACVGRQGTGIFRPAFPTGSAGGGNPLPGSWPGAGLFAAAPRFSLTLNDIGLVNAKFLCALLPRLSLPRAESFVVPLNSYLAKYRINTIQRIAAFMGQVAVESSEFCKLVESTYYRDAAHLRDTFPSAFKTAHAADYIKHPEKLANFVYAGKNGNGDEKSGDGWKYRGRGLMQLTFRNNYSAFAKDTGVDAVNHPELLEEPRMAVYSAAWFWNETHLNSYADRGNFKGLTLRINAKALVIMTVSTTGSAPWRC
ncbi:glycoside hydrolase family 19 protein [Rhodanobacter sp. FDAARGOS 1247]|uniref:glycoside hydrolase family 19 protein n=1 Tax=Rhodanobacter sp. FDAARGOS 1247 TaxID=2778082 RepID=UPI00194E34A8|nr:glycoside hydrolase family 19 protein [Rhodanobacter sp. FDAARGOS 1247]QRP63747.1 glycoside hydrolase family 19 protein [Rhodanobacter sp. FDAARGOS 1247]